MFETIGIASAQVTVNGTQMTINPSGTFASNTTYNVRISATALEDTSGNSFYGIHDAVTWNFTSLQSGDDYGDAPDTAAGTSAGNYKTLSTDNGPSHAIVPGLYMGRTVDADSGALQGNRAQADDVQQAAPDDEDGLNDPAHDLLLTIGSQPTVSVIVTNMTGGAATLTGWIDIDHDGEFESTERAQIAVPDGTDRQLLTLMFPSIPKVLGGYIGETYARFRLGSDAAATNPTGASAGGEVEDYTATILVPVLGAVASSSLIAHATGGGPVLADFDSFGSSVASLGDLDGDGVPDLAFGSPSDDTDSTLSGAVYIALMNSNGTVKTLNKITTQTGGPSLSFANRFGISLAPLGDLDGDGIPDLAAGAERTGGNAFGAAHILFLNANGTVKSSRTISSNMNGGPPLSTLDGFGSGLAAIGDLDRDGVVDLAVGARSVNAGGSSRGAVYVLFLNANGTAKGYQTIAHLTGGGPTLANDDQFGGSVAALGDLDGDAVPDLAVGATGDDTGASGAGAVHVLFMNANGTVKSSQKIARQTGGGPALAAGDQFGTSLASLGDINADGVADLAVGAVGDSTGAFGAGAVYVLSMNDSGTAQSFTKIASNTNGGPALDVNDQFGRSLALIHDLNGDGAIDLAVGAHGDDTGGTDRGGAHILFLQPNPILAVTVSPAIVDEDGTPNLTYTFHRTGDTSSALTVGFDVTGSADFNTDYSQSGAATFNATGGTVTFPVGLSTVAVTIDPTTDSTLEPDETVALTLTAGSGYLVGGPNQATGTIATDDTIVTGVTSPTANGTLKIGDVVDVAIAFAEAVFVTGTPQLELETGSTNRKIDYLTGSGTTTLTFRYTVQAGDVASDLDYASAAALTLNGGSIQAAAGHNARLGLAPPGTAGSLGHNKSLVIDGVAPTVSNLVISTGSPSRSRITQLVINFDGLVAVASNAFTVTKRGAGGGQVGVAAALSESNGNTVATLTFSGAFTTASGALVDGNYDLRIDATKISDAAGNLLDGDGNGALGDDYLFGDQAVDAFFNLYGDTDGDGDVDGIDFAARFIPAFGSTSSNSNYRQDLDWDGDGDIDGIDFAQGFIPRFGSKRDTTGY